MIVWEHYLQGFWNLWCGPVREISARGGKYSPMVSSAVQCGASGFFLINSLSVELHVLHVHHFDFQAKRKARMSYSVFDALLIAIYLRNMAGWYTLAQDAKFLCLDCAQHRQ